MSGVDPMWNPDWETSPALDLDTACRAVRAVCGNASDAADAHQLIAALGLAPALPEISRQRTTQRQEPASGNGDDDR